jgi:hypothetical protein
MERMMPNVLITLIAGANTQMRDFLKRAEGFPMAPKAIDGPILKSLSAQLAEVGAALRAASPEMGRVARAHAVYGEYKELLVQLNEAIEPLHGQLLVRQVQLGVSRLHLESARSWASAYSRTR